MRALTSILATLALALFLALPAAAEPPGALEGRVVNGTKGGGPVSGLEVTLRSSSSEAGPELRATTDGGGAFRFAGLPATSPMSYTLSVNYAGVEYKSPAPVFGPGEEVKQVELPVYETGENSSAIQADLAHVVIEVDPGSQVLVVMEFQALSNPGDRTYWGPPSAGSGKRESLRFPLPQGAVHLQTIDGLVAEDLVPLSGAEGFADVVPFQPGKREVAYSYMLDYTDRNYLLLRPVAYPTLRLNLLVSDVGAQVRAPGFPRQQTIDIEGKRYLLLAGEGLAPGQNLEVELVGLPLGRGAARAAADNLKLAAVGLLPITLVAAFAYFLMKNRRQRMLPVPIPVDIGQEKAQMIRSLAALDDSYAAAGISEPEYRRLRAEKKRRLMELWQGKKHQEEARK